MTNKITYWLPGGYITYSGDDKLYPLWLYQTFPAYIAFWKLYIKFFIVYIKEYGFLNTVNNLDLIIEGITVMINYLKDK